MASTAHTLLECDYLCLLTSLIPHVFPSEQAELVHVNGRISSLDHHISQLNSRQLHNLLLPIYTLPIEVLSHIFQQNTGREVDSYEKFKEYRKCLHQAFVLSSVSAHFRHVAFCTPELWRMIPLDIIAGRSIGQLVSLLRHCMTFTPSVDIFVNDALDEEEARSAFETVETLLTSEVTRRIKTLDLNSPYGLDVWKTKLKGFSFPMLDHLGIFGTVLNLDLPTLSTVTRLDIRNNYDSPDCLIIMPPSVRYLLLDGVGPHAFVSFLYHCPNLEECLAYDGQCYSEDPVVRFDRPLTLTHLKRLALGFVDVIMTPSSAQNLRLPSLEYLRFKHYDAGKLDGFFLLCHNVSATLTTLKIELVDDAALEYDDDLYQLCRLPFPNLRELGFISDSLEPMLSTIRVLTQRAEERNDAEPHYLPSLMTLTFNLRYDNDTGPRCLLGLLDRWRVGEASYFLFRVKGFNLDPGDWSPEVKEELRSIAVGNRQIKVSFP